MSPYGRKRLEMVVGPMLLVWTLIQAVCMTAKTAEAGEVNLDYAREQVMYFRTVGEVKDPVWVVRASDNTCPGKNLYDKTCRGWVTWASIGWIISFTPKGLNQPKDTVEWIAAHEVGHIVYDGAGLKEGIGPATEDFANMAANKWIQQRYSSSRH